MLGNLSDHCALVCTLPWVPTTSQPHVHTATEVYRWVDGTALDNYSDSWKAWERHTDTVEFTQKLAEVANRHPDNIDDMA